MGTFEPKRIFSGGSAKGRRGYLKSQKKYEIFRTVLYFAISLSLFIAGYIATKTRANLLTIIAILGCLPASKSAVGMIMFLRFQSCPDEAADQIAQSVGELPELYDMIFTSYKVNFKVDHLVYAGGTLCGYSSDASFQEREFQKHITDILKAENYKNVNVKIFTDLKKYTERLTQLNGLNRENDSQEIFEVLKSVAL